MAVVERGRHQVRRFVRRIAEHDALVAGAFVLVAALVDALRDMRRLAVKVVFEAEGLPVETVLLVTDLANGVAHDGFDLFERARRPFAVFEHALAADFTREDDELGRGQRLARHARFGITPTGTGRRPRSLIWSDTLSGWPSDTLSEVKKEAVAHGRTFCRSNIKEALCRRAVSVRDGEGNGEREQQQRKSDGQHVAVACEEGRRMRGGNSASMRPCRMHR